MLSQQLNGWREAAIQAYAVVPIDTGHPAQPAVMWEQSCSTLRNRAEAEAWLTRNFSF